MASANLPDPQKPNAAREPRFRPQDNVPDSIEKRTIGKVMRRLIPLLIACYFVAYIDRVNVGFAKLQMNQVLGLSEAAYGLGAGLFFIGYFLLEVPSNIFLERSARGSGSPAS